MLATQTPDVPPEAKNVKQIKEKLAATLKALQRRYVASDAVVTSEDGDANLLCCALEAIFIHGIKSKYVRSEAGGGGRGKKKAERGPLPQPFFWNLLKTVTHRDVVTELEKISFVGTDVGRCRAWLRLALNHGLLECYLASLFREDSALRAHYQPSALLLDGEEREVLLSYLQGLASLTFSLSYKSAVLNQWTATPLALAGLCPSSPSDAFLDPPLNGANPKELWDTASQSSGSSDTPPPPPPVLLAARGSGALRESRAAPHHSSDLSLDSSQLSSSISSDSLLQGQDRRSPTAEHWSSCDLDTTSGVGAKRPQRDSLTDLRGSGHGSQDSMREDSFASSTGPDQFSETALFSGSDSEIQGPPTPSRRPADQPQSRGPSDSEPPAPAGLDEEQLQPEEEEEVASSVFHADTEEVTVAPDVQENAEAAIEETEKSERRNSASSTSRDSHRSTSIISRKTSSESLPTSRSWISEDDIYKPHPEELADSEDTPPPAPPADLKVSPSPPSVVHRRQIGLSNPFRGLLRLGHLERRGAVGIWRDYYCELSPFEFRLYLSAEERTCCDNCSLLRCEDARLVAPEGRFDLSFAGKRLYLRAADRGEAEDWVERIIEAVNKCRPASSAASQRGDDQWEVLLPSVENGVEEVSSASSATSSPEHGGGEEAACVPQMDWTRTLDVESDAIKESVLYFSTDPEARTWTPLVFSLSLEALKGFRVQEGRKSARVKHAIGDIRDVVPDVSVGGPAFFKLLTVRETLRLRAENPEEARSWRALIRRALDSYLDSGEDESSEDAAAAAGRSGGAGGNLQRLVQHGLKEDGALLAHLCTVASEKGLDAQSFKCAGCPQQIGPSSGRGKKLCEFSGQYYCERCHGGDTSIIPSRMVHNWDLTQREVSKKALWLLSEVEAEPLLNVELLNPDLLQHSESMSQVHALRRKLRLLGDYLLTCRSGAAKKLQARTGRRSYLLESSDLYSVKDLRQIAEGQYVSFLLALLQHAANHVFHCDLCTQRGFICQICHANDIIFPFQFETTTRCKDCKAVFHAACEASAAGCPRCERMKRYLERDLQD